MSCGLDLFTRKYHLLCRSSFYVFKPWNTHLFFKTSPQIVSKISDQRLKKLSQHICFNFQSQYRNLQKSCWSGESHMFVSLTQVKASSFRKNICYTCFWVQLSAKPTRIPCDTSQFYENRLLSCLICWVRLRNRVCSGFRLKFYLPRWKK